jgi:hypothetical protein
MRSVVLVVAGVLIVLGTLPAASAQTRLSLEGGLLVPLGDFADRAELSPRFGLRAEFQSVNVLGQRRLLSYFARVSFADLAATEEAERFLAQWGGGSGPYLIEAGGGVRVYSQAAPLFVVAGASYVRCRPAGEPDGRNGIGLAGGLGFAVPIASWLAEGEVALHGVLLDGGGRLGDEELAQDLQYVTALVGFALPF